MPHRPPARTRPHTALFAPLALLATLGASLCLPAAAEPVRMRSVDLESVQIAYREKGKGQPVLFVHPLLTDSRMWLDQLNALCETRRCLAPDASGHGFSSPLTYSKVDSNRYADELLQFLDAVSVKQPVDIVALSGGGNIAALACAKAPGRCRSLVLISTVLGSDNLDAAGVRYRAENARTVVIEGKDTLFRRFNEYIVASGASLTARARYKTMLEQTSYETFVAFLTTAQAPATGDIAPQLRFPVMFPVGQGDTVLTPALAAKAVARFPDARLVELPAVGRLLPLEAPAELNDALSRFWKDVDTTTTGGKR